MTKQQDGKTSYFGTGVKIAIPVGIVYLLWRLFHGAWKGPGHGGWNPWGGGGNADQGSKPTNDTSSQQNKGGGGNASPGSQGPGANKGTNQGGGWNESQEDNTPGQSEYVFKDGGTPESHGYKLDSNGVYRDPRGLSIDDPNSDGTKTVNGIRIYGYPLYGINGPYVRTSFISAFYDDAVKAHDISGIFPETMFAQAFIEGSDSKGSFSDADTVKYANNYFGIKADPTWGGDTWTDSYGNAWRKYSDVGESLRDYYAFLANNSRYKDSGVFDATNPQDQLAAIANAGYAGSTPTEIANYTKTSQSLVPWIAAQESIVSPGTDNSAANPIVQKAQRDWDNAKTLPMVQEAAAGSFGLLSWISNPKVKYGVGSALILGSGWYLYRQFGSSKKKRKFAA